MGTDVDASRLLLEGIREAKASLARADFATYCEYVHERPLFAHQRAWARELQREGARALLIAPPGSLKSTTVSYFVEWCIGRNQDFTVLHIMNTATQATRQVMSVADTIAHNAQYHRTFPDVKPDKGRGWSHDTLFVQRKDTNNPYATVYGTGIDGPYQGVHVDMIIVDDPTDQQDVRSQVTMQQQRERIRGVMLDRLNPGGSIIGILTRWGEADLVRDFEDIGFDVQQYPVEGRYPWGRLLFPEWFGDDVIDRIRSTKDRGGGGVSTGLYMLTYMCDPGAASGSKVKREWWQYYVELPAVDRIIHSWDLSTGRKGGDYSAFGVWGVGEHGYYLIDAGRWSLMGDALIEKMKLMAARDRPKAILVEDVGTSIPVVDYLKAHTRLPIVPVKPGSRDKVSRLEGVVHMIEARRVWLPAHGSWTTEYVDEMASFPGGHYDDQVDQTTQALEYMEHRGAYSQEPAKAGVQSY
mgnify:CR=1 FL=1